MTTPETAPEVTQADRDAAKALLDRLHIREHETGSFRSWDETVEAFARHRLTPRQDGLREALAPFAREARRLQLREDQDRYSFANTGLSNGDLRRAFLALNYPAALSDISPLANDTGALREDVADLLDDIEDEWIDHYLRPDSAERAKCKHCGGDDFFKSSIEHKPGCIVGRIRAALSPDDGEV